VARAAASDEPGATTMKRDTRNTPLGREDMLRLISLSFYPKPARVHFVALFRDEAWAGFVGTGRIAGGLWPIVR